MLALANTLAAHAARMIRAARHEPGLWTISVQGRVVGSLVCEAGAWRLSWFDAADPRLAGFTGALDGDVETLAARLGARLGQPVCLDSLSV